MDSPKTSLPYAPTALSAQWRNPSDILSLLLLTGGDIVQKALAQQFGVSIGELKGFRLYLTPVAFSFGWVGYAFTTVASIAGNHQLMPNPENRSIVINCDTGYARVNRSWILDRLLRDHKIRVDDAKTERQDGLRISLRIDNFTLCSGRPMVKIDKVWLSGCFTIAFQLILAAIPWILYNDWAVFLVTAAGTVFALITGSLRQWADEKWPSRRLNAIDSFPEPATEAGSGQGLSPSPSGNTAASRDVDIERGRAEATAVTAAVLLPRPAPVQATENASATVKKAKQPKLKSKVVCLSQGNGHSLALLLQGTGTAWDLEKLATASSTTHPHTPLVLLALCIAWICLLISVSGLKQHTWYLVGVGLMGMLQNIYAATASRCPASIGLAIKPLSRRPTILATNAREWDKDGYNQYKPAPSSEGKEEDPKYFDRLLKEDLGPAETIGVRGAIREAEKLFPGAGFAMMPEWFPALTRRVDGERYRHARERRFWEWMRDHADAETRLPPGAANVPASESNKRKG